MTQYDQTGRRRRSLRLKDYDYSQNGAYFITICAHNRECLFGRIVEGDMVLNDVGRMIESVWNDLPERFPGLSIDASVVMPNHTHGIILIENAPVGANLVFAQKPDVGGDDAPVGANLVFTQKPDVGGDDAPVGANLVFTQKPDVGEDDAPVGANLVFAQDANPDIGRIQDSPVRKQRPVGTVPGTVGRIVQACKSLTTYKYIVGVKQHGWPSFPGKVWQRNYYEHIIRGEKVLNAIREYILCNPGKWADDPENPMTTTRL